MFEVWDLRENMITKDNLLDMLKKSMNNEDEFVISYGKGFIGKIAQIDELSNADREEIKDYFQVLLEDSERNYSDKK